MPFPRKVRHVHVSANDQLHYLIYGTYLGFPFVRHCSWIHCTKLYYKTKSIYKSILGGYYIIIHTVGNVFPLVLVLVIVSSAGYETKSFL